MPNDTIQTFAAPDSPVDRTNPAAERAQAPPMVPAAQHVALRWMLAALIAPALSVLAASGGPWHALPPIVASLFAVGCGWVVVLLLAPWRTMRDLHPDRPVIRILVENVRNITVGEREIPLKAVLLDRRDEIGELSVLLHELAVEVIDNRRHARLLRRRMDDSIRKETGRATAHLQRQVNTDPLTGLGNRRTLEQRIEELTRRESDQDRLLAAMAIDLDHFKPINDALGHAVGDQCLVFLADLLRSSVRLNDSAIRLGGDEFIVLLPEVTIEQARFLAERLRSLYTQMPWPHPPPPPTLSIGLSAAVIGTLENPMDLIREADAALYESKRAGRGRITVFGDARAAA